MHWITTEHIECGLSPICSPTTIAIRDIGMSTKRRDYDEMRWSEEGPRIRLRLERSREIVRDGGPGTSKARRETNVSLPV